MADEPVTPETPETPPETPDPAAEAQAEAARLVAERDALAAQVAALNTQKAALEQQAPVATPGRSYGEMIAGAKQFAEKGDPVASMILEQHRAIQVLAAPPELRDDIVKEFQRGGYEDVSEARVAVERRKTAEREQAQATEIARLKAQLEAVQKQQSVNAVPGSGAREGPTPPDTSKPITEDEWNQLNAGLSREERRANQKLLNQGKITIKG